MSLRMFSRTKCRTCIMTLCVMYLLVMIAFHFDIQDPESGAVRRPPRQSVAENVSSSTAQGSKSVALVSNEKVTPKSQTKSPDLGFQNAYHNRNAILLPDSGVRHVTTKKYKSPIRKCFGADNGTKSEFIEIVKERVYVFSAYWDTRPNDFDNKSNGSLVRIIAVLRLTGLKPALQCGIRLVDGDIVKVPLQYYEMCENHGRPFGGYILSCQMPPEVTSQPCSVMISEKDAKSWQGSHTLHVAPLAPQSHRNKFAICVPPLYGNINGGRLVEFIELSRLLGAERLVFYDYKISDAVATILEYYQERNVVDVVPWPYPERLQHVSWYNGQLVAIQDCLYRNMPSTEYLVFNDMDEYIVPHVHADWFELVEAMFQSSQCAYQFPSAFFPPPIDANGSVVMASTRRTERFSAIRTKCMVKPYLIFEKGIHHVSKPIWAHLEVKRMPERVAFLHHYRSCVTDFGMSCKKFVTDERMQKYAAKLRENVPKHLLTS